ncbi:MAG: MBL fold metallo-hydrolase [Patescibacteria group bacterium]|nr:MBL fold metallo-hydrolase [Patescibacteria group bacterium]
MNIFWHGQSCFEITTSPTKSNQVKIVIDPFSEGIGLRVPKLEADILCITHSYSDHNNLKAVSGSSFLIQDPGEYEIKGVFIQGIPSWHDQKEGKERGENIIYTLEAEDLRLCHLGDLDQKELTSEQLEKIGEIDILMIPIGGVFTISAKEALKIMSQIEPKITIPMHYQIPKLKIKLEGLDKFLKTLGLKSIEPLPKLSIKKKDFSEEEAKIIVLKP